MDAVELAPMTRASRPYSAAKAAMLGSRYIVRKMTAVPVLATTKKKRRLASLSAIEPQNIEAGMRMKLYRVAMRPMSSTDPPRCRM